MEENEHEQFCVFGEREVEQLITDDTVPLEKVTKHDMSNFIELVLAAKAQELRADLHLAENTTIRAQELLASKKFYLNHMGRATRQKYLASLLEQNHNDGLHALCALTPPVMTPLHALVLAPLLLENRVKDEYAMHTIDEQFGLKNPTPSIDYEKHIAYVKQVVTDLIEI